MAKETMTKEQKKIQEELQAKLEEQTGAGLEGSDGCAAVSYLTVLQDNSPQCKKKGEQYIEGAEPGMLYDTGTGKLYDGDLGVRIIPVGFQRIINIWGPERSGFRGVMDIDDPRYQNARRGDGKDEWKKFDAEGNELVDTRNHFVFIIDEDDKTLHPAIMSCSGSKVKISAKFLSKLRNLLLPSKDGLRKFNPPTYAFSYRLTTFLDKNKRGDEFYNFAVPEKDEQVLDLDTFAQSENAHKQIAEGTMRAALPAHDDSGDPDVM